MGEQLQQHPVLTVFPEMAPDQFAVFLDDVRANGIREPVILWRDVLIDGRHRLRAATELGIDCPRRLYDGDDPVGMAVSLNLTRRHLNESQRGMIAAGLSNLTNGKTKGSANLQSPAVSRADAANMVGVSERTVNHAAAIRATAPALVPIVQNALMRVATAAQLARHAPDAVPQIAEAFQRGDTQRARELQTNALAAIRAGGETPQGRSSIRPLPARHFTNTEIGLRISSYIEELAAIAIPVPLLFADVSDGCKARALSNAQDAIDLINAVVEELRNGH